MATTYLEQAWRQTVDALVRRDGAVEIAGTCAEDPGRFGPGYRTRLLAMNERCMLVQVPLQSQAMVYFQPGAVVQILAIDGAHRWQLVSMVQKVVRYQLNQTMAVQALRLDYPHEVHSAQRREYFRVSCAGLQLQPVILEPILDPAPTELHDPGSPDATGDAASSPADPAPFKATLLNIGGGGLGVAAPQYAADTVLDVDRYLCTFQLPTFDQGISLLTSCVHCELQQDGTHYLGLCFDFAESIERRAAADQIVRFTAWLQRKQLQRSRLRRR